MLTKSSSEYQRASCDKYICQGDTARKATASKATRALKIVLIGKYKSGIVIMPKMHGKSRRAKEFTPKRSMESLVIISQQLTEKIRRAIRPRGNGSSGASQIVGQPVRQLVNLRQELLNSVTRGLITVPDQPSSMAVHPAVAEPIQQGNPYPGQSAMGNPDANQSASLDHGQTGFEGVGMPQAQSTPVQYQAPDWTAASVTVVISQ